MEIRLRGPFPRFSPALALLLLPSVLACAGAEEEPGAVRGRFVQNVARMKDGRSEVTYMLFRGDGRSDRRELVFDEAPDLLSNTEIKVWGSESAGRIRVDRYEVMSDAPRKGPLGTSREALIDAAPIAPTNMVMVMVDTAGTGTFEITREQMHAELFSEEDPTSLVHYYRENSYGMHELTGQVAPGTYTYPMTGCDYDAMTDALAAQVHADTGVPEFDLYLWYFPENMDCEWAGLSSGQDTYYNGSSGCVVLAQEPGHSFGLAHSSSLTCTGADGMPAAFADDPQTNCTHSEYGNGYDTMGGGCRHFSGYQKVYRTYLQGCNVAQMLGGGTITLHPIETPCNGVQVVQVPMPKVRPFDSEGGGSGDRTTQLAYYNVEFRAPIGAFDGGTNSPMVPSVLINAAPDWRVFGQGGGGRGRGNTRGEHIWLLDMAPTSTGTGGGRGGRGGNGSGHALAVGQTFTDPAGGVAITTEAVSATSATIRVDITAPLPPMGGSGGGGSGSAGSGGAVVVPPGTIATCLDDRPLMMPGPASCDGSFAGSGNVAGGGGMAGGGGLGGSMVSAGSGPVAAGAGGLTGGGSGGSAGGPVDVVTPDSELESGCGCRVPGESRSNGSTSVLALLGVAGAALARRRREVA
jgi:MYXO-CTERM domain-containing protein